MTRFQTTMILAVTVLIAGQSTVWAANPMKLVSSQYNRQWNPNNKKKSNNKSHSGGISSNKLPKTKQLDGDLQQMQGGINGLAAKLNRIEKSIETARKRAQDVASMIKSIGRLDDKVYRIKRELDSLTKIPQLRMLKPLAKGLGKVRDQLHTVRKKADEANRNHLKPLISRLKKIENKVDAKAREIRGLASQVKQGRYKLEELSSFVASRGFKKHEVRALESLSKSVRPTLRSTNNVISDMNRELGNVDRDFNSLAQKLNGIAKAKSSVKKLERDLAAADKAARDLNKVLSKKISIKFPVKVSVSVRQIIEAPGKLIDVVVKPLQKLAEKALKPVTKKFQINLKMPREITALTGKLNSLKSAANNLNSPTQKIEKALKKQIPGKFKSKLSNLVSKSTSNFAR